MSSATGRVAFSAISDSQSSGGSSVPPLPFDRPSAMEFVSARAQFLDRFLSSWPLKPFTSVLDAGTGVGHFARHVSRNKNLRVVGLDARSSNVLEASRRSPEIEFRVCDVESSTFAEQGEFDLVLALGLLYHLENPFRAIRNLAIATRDAIVVESLIAPGRSPKGWLLDEFPGDDQALASVAWHLTETGIAKLLYRAGISHVYRAKFKPPHREFHGGLFRRQTRAFVIGTRGPLQSQEFTRIPEPSICLDRAYYLRWPLRDMLRPVLKWNRRK